MDKKELRRKVLQLHYDLSNGSTILPVLRPTVGEKLSMDFNGDELLAAIMYLEEKGLLKSGSNVDDTITSYGIDEVEENFPTLGPPTSTEEEENELLDALTTVDEKLDLAKKGLLLYTELQETQRNTEVILERNIKQDTELWRDFDRHKTTTYWEKYPKSKYTSETGRLELWRGFLIKALEAQGSQENKKQQLVQRGHHFTARKILRDILKKAKSKIDIQDNYVSVDLLAVLSEYAELSPNISIRILTDKASSSFKSDLQAFIKEFGSLIEVKIHSSCHDRFIIIDGYEVYHSGHSFKDLGSKASLINLVNDNNVRLKFIAEFQQWWDSGSNV